MTPTGKIARLPRPVRDELNRRLLDGGTGPRLVKWLNAQPDVVASLAEHHGGRPITVQNLSAWRQGGLAAWCRQEEIRHLARQLGTAPDDFESLADHAQLADHLAQATAVALMGQLRDVDRMPAGPRRLRATLAVVTGLVRLRRSDRERERAEQEQERPGRELVQPGEIRPNPGKSNPSSRAPATSPDQAPGRLAPQEGRAPAEPVVALRPPAGSLRPARPLAVTASAAAPSPAAMAAPAPSSAAENPTKSSQIQPAAARLAPVAPIVTSPAPATTPAGTGSPPASRPIAVDSPLLHASRSPSASSLPEVREDRPEERVQSGQIRPNPGKSNPSSRSPHSHPLAVVEVERTRLERAFERLVLSRLRVQPEFKPSGPPPLPLLDPCLAPARFRRFTSAP